MTRFEYVKLGFEGDDVLGFSGGEYSSHKVYFWSFHFYDDQLHSIDIVFKRPDDLKQLREDIIEYVTQRYDKESMEEPDNDGILVNKWYFEDSRQNRTDLINLILYETAKGETTYTLTFVNIKLFEGSEGKK